MFVFRRVHCVLLVVRLHDAIVACSGVHSTLLVFIFRVQQESAYFFEVYAVLCCGVVVQAFCVGFVHCLWQCYFFVFVEIALVSHYLFLVTSMRIVK